MNKEVKKLLPIHLSFTDTPKCVNPEKGYKKSTIKITGDYVSNLPDFFDGIKQFDDFKQAQLKTQKGFEDILNKKIAGKARQEQKNRLAFHKKCNKIN